MNTSNLERISLKDVATLFGRACLLRCPRCGRGKLFKRGYTMFERCPNCDWRYEREEGYWTGAVAVNLVVAELIIAAVVIPLAAMQVPILPLVLFGLPLPILLPFLFYWHAKAFWMFIDFVLHPVPLR